MSKKKTDKNNIFYYSQVLQEILDLQLDLNMQEIGFTMVFKAAYIYYKGKVPIDKLCDGLWGFNKGIVITPFYSEEGELMSFIVDSKKTAKLIHEELTIEENICDECLEEIPNKHTEK